MFQLATLEECASHCKNLAEHTCIGYSHSADEGQCIVYWGRIPFYQDKQGYQTVLRKPDPTLCPA